MRITAGTIGRRCSFHFVLFLPLFLLNFSACGTAQVVGIPREKAAEQLKSGNTDFILNAELPADFSEARTRLKELSLVHPAAPFYASLLLNLNRADSPSPAEIQNSRALREFEILLLAAALESPSPAARREAALALVPLILESSADESTENRNAREILNFLDSGNAKEKAELPPSLRAACLYRLGRYDEIEQTVSEDNGYPLDSWETALSLLAAWKTGGGEATKEKILSFLLGTLPREIRQWTSAEAFASEGLLSPEESAAVSARLFPGDYNAILEALRPALLDGGIIFFRYPELVPDLGRAFQYTSAREEGAEIFALWKNLLKGEKPLTPPSDSATDEQYGGLAAFIDTMTHEARTACRYLILHYAGRIERAREEYAASDTYFTEALELAPNAFESDSCIWYMLMNALSTDISAAVSLALTTMPKWNDLSYFGDILDRLSAGLTVRRQWNVLEEIFSALEKRNADALLAQYAWILGRAAQEGFFKTERSAESFFRAAYNEKAPLYYRIMAAAMTGARFTPYDSKMEKTAPEKENNDAAEFLSGFFEYGAASFALPFIQKYERELSAPESRKIAENLAAAERRKESLDFVSRYIRRKDSLPNVKDFQLFYPRPFGDLVKKYAKKAELRPELFYALMRTESYFESGIVSRSGAVGLAQLMAPTAGDMAGRIARGGGPDYRGPDGIGLNDPETNIHIGSYYLRYLVEYTGNPMPAILAYNGGMGRVRRWLAADNEKGALPHDLFLETVEITETRDYGRNVLAAAAVYGLLYYGKSAEDIAAELYPDVFKR